MEAFCYLASKRVKHFCSGKIPYFTTPPVREVSEHAEFGAIVTEWGKEFDVEEVFQNETTAVIAGLPSMADTSHVQMPSTAPLAMDTNISMVIHELSLVCLDI